MPRSRNKIKVELKKLGREKAWGQCWKEDKIIEIDERCSPRFFLQVLAHEVCHSLWPEASETKIENAGRILGNVIWDMGYRRIYTANKKMKV